MSTSSDRYVVLRDGLAVPVQPVLLLLDLEARGCTITQGPDHKITVRPAHVLTEQDRAALTRWRDHVRALVAYADSPPEVQ